ncbi:MAG: FMN-binding protein, partial [Firmicutes bacterium]|nr:FMN-binding protein [Bacillota bacterium]
MEMTGAQILMETLLEQGTDVIFGYPGGTVLDLYEQIYRNEGRIRHVLPSHEQGGIHAADGYARATGKTGVVLATSGPGATNLVTGIATAYLDSIPLVIITGNVPTTLIGQDNFQEVDVFSLTYGIVKHSYRVARVEELAEQVVAANGAEIDGVSGATYTSDGCRAAVRNALDPEANPFEADGGDGGETASYPTGAEPVEIPSDRKIVSATTYGIYTKDVTSAQDCVIKATLYWDLDNDQAYAVQFYEPMLPWDDNGA